MPNRLASETSPYLLQHASNPVEWFTGGDEAWEKARAEDKPVFLSIGYSACHWCHVMEHESFEDEQIAQLLNDHFVAVKVDREERPDLDQIYMAAVQIMTGRGGWPMSVFLTTDLQPFFGGTYWPPRARHGMPGFEQVLHGVTDAWRERRQQAADQAEKLTAAIRQSSSFVAPDEVPDAEETLRGALVKLQSQFDSTHGGLGTAPKFPHPMGLQLLLRLWRRTGQEPPREMTQLTLDKMSQGGIYDHLAGGFARYSVDARWLVPHFEKMLYDNALLASAYLDGYLACGEPRYADVARQTMDYVLKYMTDPSGGFHSTEDADSEGEEGKFYVWSPAEIREVLGDEAAERFCCVYDVTESGNFEGRNILNLSKTIEQIASIRGWQVDPLREELAASRAKLLAVRDGRVRPGKDDKVLVSWNGLMIDALARAAGILQEPAYLDAATNAADFIGRQMVRRDGRLLHSWRDGQARFDAYLDDYACLSNALVSLYEASFDERWLDWAVQLIEVVLERFVDTDEGGFFFVADDHERLIARNKDFLDSSVPSGNAMAATALIRLGHLCGREDFLDAAQRTIHAATALIQHSPSAAGQLLCALDMQTGPFAEVVIVGGEQQPSTSRVIADLRQRYAPNHVLACRTVAGEAVPPHLAAIFQDRGGDPSAPTAYVCEHFACQAPATGEEAITQAWDALASRATPPR